MRIDLDDDLLKQAIELSGGKPKNEVVDEALRLLLRACENPATRKAIRDDIRRREARD